MRFVWAVVAFFLAAVLIGAGVAQRTVFLGPSSDTETIADAGKTPYILIDGKAMHRLDGTQRLRASGADAPVFGAYGRTADMEAWLADQTYTHVTLKSDGSLRSQEVKPTVDAPTLTDAQNAANNDALKAGLTAPRSTSPAGSDLWLEEFTADSTLDKQLNVPDDISVLVSTDGTKAAPSKVTVTWPVDNSTPWVGPLLTLGGIALLTGVVLYFLGMRNLRRSKGPRRRGVPALEETQPMDEIDAARARGVGSVTRRRFGKESRRTFLAVPLAVITVGALAGCSPAIWPKGDASSPTPSPSSTVVVPENQMPPAVTEAQAAQILTRLSQTVTYADENKSASVASQRLTGAALAARETNYKLRAAVDGYAAPDAVPAGPYSIILPQQSDGWPRLVMAVWIDEKDKTNPPRVLTLKQEDPWSAYQLAYSAKLEAGAELKDLAAAQYGALRVATDSPLLAMAPKDIASAYATVIDKGDQSEFADKFDIKNDRFLPIIQKGRESRLAAFNQSGAQTGTLAFSSTEGDQEPLALSTTSSGAIVAVDVKEIDTVKPKSADVVIRVGDNKAVSTLSGVTESPKGFLTTYGDQLYFYVPSQQSGEKIRLLGFSTELLKAEEIK